MRYLSFTCFSDFGKKKSNTYKLLKSIQKLKSVKLLVCKPVIRLTLP